MKRMLTVLLVLVMLTMSCAMAETLRVGMECDYAPYNWTQASESDEALPLASGGYADGYDVRIAKLVGAYMGYDVEIVKTVWENLVPELLSGNIDCIIAGMSPTEERMATIDFSDPYYTSDLVIVVRKDGGYADATSLADFAGAKITGQQATFHYDVIDQIEGVNKMPAQDTFSTMIVALSAGDIDGYISERPGAESAMATNPDLTYVAFESGKGFDASTDDTTLAVGVAKGSDLTAKINEALATISEEDRQQIMLDALSAQPSAE